MEPKEDQSGVHQSKDDESEETEEDENVKKPTETDLSPRLSEKPKKTSKWKKLTTSRDKNNKKDRGKDNMKGKGKENIEMEELNDGETGKDSGKSLGKSSKVNTKDRGLFKRPSLKDYKKKWKGGGRRRSVESPVSPKEIKETTFRNGTSPKHNNNNEENNEEKRSRKLTKTMAFNDSPQITTFEQDKDFGIVDGAGMDKMMWARRAFFMSTEKIFPGFIRNYELRNSRSRDPTGVKLRTSIPLKMILLAHSYFVPIWFIAFLCLQEFAANSLKPLHNHVHYCLTYVCMVTDALRLYAGFVSRDDMQLLALYWMATVILQTPMMCFIFATHSFSVNVLILNSTMDLILAIILLLEILIGFAELRGLVNSEMNLLHMARQMNEMQIMNEHGRNRQPRVVNSVHAGPRIDWSGSSDDNDDNRGDIKETSSPNKSILVAKQGEDPL